MYLVCLRVFVFIFKKWKFYKQGQRQKSASKFSVKFIFSKFGIKQNIPWFLIFFIYKERTVATGEKNSKQRFLTCICLINVDFPDPSVPKKINFENILSQIAINKICYSKCLNNLMVKTFSTCMRYFHFIHFVIVELKPIFKHNISKRYALQTAN